MKLTIETSALERAASIVASMTPGNTTMPILENVLIDATGDSIAFAASDMESYVTAAIPAEAGEIHAPGRVTVPAKILANAIRGVGAKNIALESEGTKLRVVAGKSRMQLATASADEFPDWPAFKRLGVLSIPQGSLKASLLRVLPAVPTKDSRRYLLGVFFDFSEDRDLFLVATDGRIGIASAPHGVSVEWEGEWTPEGFSGEKKDGKPRGVIVPAKVAQEVARQLSDGPDSVVRVEISNRQIAFEFGGVRYVSNLIAGSYPPWRQVMPRTMDFITTAQVDRSTLLAEIKRAGNVREKDDTRVTLSFAHGVPSGTATVRSAASEVGEYEGEVVAELKGDPMSFRLKSSYLTALLGGIPNETVEFRSNGPTRQLFLGCSLAPDDLWLVMPIKPTAELEQAAAPAEESEEEDDGDNEQGE